MTTIITLKKKSGGAEVWKDPSVARNKFCRGVSCQLLMELIEKCKRRRKIIQSPSLFSKKSTATSLENKEELQGEWDM